MRLALLLLAMVGCSYQPGPSEEAQAGTAIHRYIDTDAGVICYTVPFHGHVSGEAISCVRVSP